MSRYSVLPPPDMWIGTDMQTMWMPDAAAVDMAQDVLMVEIKRSTDINRTDIHRLALSNLLIPAVLTHKLTEINAKGAIKCVSSIDGVIKGVSPINSLQLMSIVGPYRNSIFPVFEQRIGKLLEVDPAQMKVSYMSDMGTGWNSISCADEMVEGIRLLAKNAGLNYKDGRQQNTGFNYEMQNYYGSFNYEMQNYYGGQTPNQQRDKVKPPVLHQVVTPTKPAQPPADKAVAVNDTVPIQAIQANQADHA
ncbi:hypothetical protein T492DRAFT_864794 [Pavlovales sp. CCMP2436]|nr:hypothetical protein T492DRAFT_864794 [Pavlovales sp. CCMP2436]